MRCSLDAPWFHTCPVIPEVYPQSQASVSVAPGRHETLSSPLQPESQVSVKLSGKNKTEFDTYLKLPKTFFSQASIKTNDRKKIDPLST